MGTHPSKATKKKTRRQKSNTNPEHPQASSPPSNSSPLENHKEPQAGVLKKSNKKSKNRKKKVEKEQQEPEQKKEEKEQPPTTSIKKDSNVSKERNPTPSKLRPDSKDFSSSSESSDEVEELESIPDVITGLSKSEVSKEDFELLAVIGRGSFAKVMQVRKKGTREIYAMKVMRKDNIIQKNQITHTKDEKAILQKVSHPFIVRLHYAFQTPDKLYMIMDYVNGGELFYHLKNKGKFELERVRFYSAEIASAIEHLHTLGIVYRDLKPENILLNKDGHVVITDFGLSKEIPLGKDEGTNTFCGTPEYLAPEVLKGHRHGHAVDWWSLGTLIFEMLTGLPPFYSKNINVMYQKILTGQLAFPSNIDEDAQSLLEGLLCRDVDKRFKAKEVKAHPFFRKIDWEKLNRKELEPPWKPPIKSASDTTQIDECFTNEEAIDSFVEKTTENEMDENDADVFEGFTYAGDSVNKTKLNL